MSDIDHKLNDVLAFMQDNLPEDYEIEIIASADECSLELSKDGHVIESDASGLTELVNHARELEGMASV